MEVTLEVIPHRWLDIEWNRKEHWQHGMSVSLAKRALKKEMESLLINREPSSLCDSCEGSLIFFGCGGNTFPCTERTPSKNTLSIPQGLLPPHLLCVSSPGFPHTHTQSRLACTRTGENDCINY